MEGFHTFGNKLNQLINSYLGYSKEYKMKKIQKQFSFDQEKKDNDVASYYLPVGCIQTNDSDMHFLIDEDREKLNKLIEEFLKTAFFKS